MALAPSIEDLERIHSIGVTSSPRCAATGPYAASGAAAAEPAVLDSPRTSRRNSLTRAIGRVKARASAAMASTSRIQGMGDLTDRAVGWLFNDAADAAATGASVGGAAPATAVTASTSGVAPPQVQAAPPPPAVMELPGTPLPTVAGPALRAQVVGWERKKGRKPDSARSGAAAAAAPDTPTKGVAGMVTIFVVEMTYSGGRTTPSVDHDSGDEGDEGAAGSGRPDSTWTLRKRYNDFKALHAALVELHDETSTSLAVELPEKERGAQTDARLEARREALDIYLHNVCLQPHCLGAQRVLSSFFQCGRHGFPESALLWKLREI